MVRMLSLIPTEFAVGVVAMSLQQLYAHWIYPLLLHTAEPSVYFQPNLTEVNAYAANNSVASVLELRLADAVSAFKADEEPAVTSSRDVISTWEVRRLSGFFLSLHEEPYAYFFRVSVRNSAELPCALESVANFYVLRFPGGLVYPLSSTSEGRGKATLRPGESHCYAGIFLADHWALEAAGGVVLERREIVAGVAEDERFLSSTLARVRPAESDSVVAGDLHALVGDSHFVGMLDLRDVQYV